ncbi:MAG: flagellar filament capping protein FliD [Pirellulales bacterium]
MIDFQKLATSGTKASFTTTPVNGANAGITFTAKTAGAALGGVAVSFVDDPAVSAGAETVVYDANAKTLVFHIDAGTTTADQAIAALGRDATASAAFGATRTTGGNGTGLIAVTDGGITSGPKATITTAGVDSPNAKIVFTAVNGGSDYDNVAIEFVDDPSVIGGSEVFEWDDSDPQNKKLTIRIDQGNTNAKSVIDALNADPTASQYFKAALADGSTGLGKVVPEDSTLTLGGALVEATAAGKQTTLQETVDLINASAPGKLTASIVNNRLQLVDTSVDGGFDFEVEQLFGSKAAEDSGHSRYGVRRYDHRRADLRRPEDRASENLERRSRARRLGRRLDHRSQWGERRGGFVRCGNIGRRTGSDQRRRDRRAGDLQRIADRHSIAGHDRFHFRQLDRRRRRRQQRRHEAGIGRERRDHKQKRRRFETPNRRRGDHAGLAERGRRRGDRDHLDHRQLGAKKTLTVDSNVVTVGDLIKKIDNLGLTIDARVNDAGDGIVLIDKTDGTGSSFAVTEGGGSTGRDLHLLGGTKTAVIDGQSKKIVDGSQTYSIELTATDTLSDLTTKINNLNGRVRANILNNGGSVKPYSFTLFNQVQGSAAQLLVDTEGVNFSFKETVKGQDALLQIGGPGGAIAASANNTFTNLLPETTLTIKGTATAPVTVSVAKSSGDLVTAVKAFVDSYNKIRTSILSYTKYDTDTQTAAILQGDGTVQRIENEFASFASGRVFNAGPIQSLQQLGISLDDEGKLVLDESKLNTLIAEKPDDLKKFLSDDTTGLGKRMDKMIESMAGVNNSLLISRAAAISKKYDVNAAQIEFLTARLDRQKERLTTQFQNMELAISKIQSNSSYLQTLSQLAGQSTSS